MKAISKESQLKLVKDIPKERLDAAVKLYVETIGNGLNVAGSGVGEDFLKSLSWLVKALGPVAKEIGAVVFKEVLLPMIKTKAQQYVKSKSAGSGLKTAGSGLKTAGSGLKLSGQGRGKYGKGTPEAKEHMAKIRDLRKVHALRKK